jgi:hypothetical protein
MFELPPTAPEFKRNVVEPFECLRAGWDLVSKQYWLFVAICAVGIVIGSVVPFGILLGPMMCGIYLALFMTRRSQPIEFNVLFKGFDFFGDSIIATLLHMIPIMVVFVPSYIAFYVGMLVMMPRAGSDSDPTAFLTFIGVAMVFWIGLIVVLIILSVGFTFAYPLIVDRKMTGLNAVKLSIKAAMANFWRLLGLMLISGALNFLGVMLCYVGVVFVLPINFAAIAMAYEQVFGLADFQPDLPPPPPTFG